MATEEVEQRKQGFLDYYRQLPNVTLAAAKVGRNRDTVYVWRNDDPTFSAQMDEAKADWALSKVKRVKSQEWMLERVLREEFTPRQEITGKDGKDLPVPIIKVDTNVSGNNSNKKDQSIAEKN